MSRQTAQTLIRLLLKIVFPVCFFEFLACIFNLEQKEKSVRFFRTFSIRKKLHDVHFFKIYSVKLLVIIILT